MLSHKKIQVLGSHLCFHIVASFSNTTTLLSLSLSDKQVRITWRCWYPTVGVTDKEYARDTVEVREVISYRDERSDLL